MVDKVLFSHNVTEWGTPYDLYYRLDKTFHFDLDPCTTEDNPFQTRYFYTKENDGLKSEWPNDIKNIFINPPYNQIEKWLKKAMYEFYRNRKIKNIVFLLPARTDTKWFHDYIYCRNAIGQETKPIVQIRFLRGRLKFRDAKNSAPFPSMIVIFERQ